MRALWVYNKCKSKGSASEIYRLNTSYNCVQKTCQAKPSRVSPIQDAFSTYMYTKDKEYNHTTMGKTKTSYKLKCQYCLSKLQLERRQL